MTYKILFLRTLKFKILILLIHTYLLLLDETKHTFSNQDVNTTSVFGT